MPVKAEKLNSKSLAIIATHPIQYYAPIYRHLAKTPGLDLKVYYEKIPTPEEQGIQFNQSFNWDVDLLSGYDYVVGAKGDKDLVETFKWGNRTTILAHGWFDPRSRKMIQRALQRGIPVMVRGDSHLYTPRPVWKKILKYPVYRMLLPRFSVCLAVGSWNEAYYRYYGVPQSKIIKSPHSVDNDFFKEFASKVRPERNAIRKKWNIRENSFVFLFAGRMNPMKRIPDFLEAFKRLQTKYTNLHALVVGDGPSFHEIKALAERIPNITLAGFLNQTEIVQAYIASDLLVLPSNGEETWGLVVNEALCCGLKCLVSDEVGCGQDMIISGVNGLIYTCGNISELKSSMEKIYLEKGHTPDWELKSQRILKTHSCEMAVKGIIEGLMKCGNETVH